MPGDRFFVDSNVVLYCLGDDPRKRTIAATLLACTPVVSTQVLIETANVLRRKFGVSPQAIREIIDALAAVSDVRLIATSTILHALNFAERYNFSTYDSLIVAAADEAGCSTLYSEDLQHGQVLDCSLTVINPFRVF